LSAGTEYEYQAAGLIQAVFNLSARAIRFAGSDEGGENWACLASLIETCKLNGANPQTYFTDLLTRLVNGWPQKRIDGLMPWHWAPQRPP
jgi:hypothetical protein